MQELIISYSEKYKVDPQLTLAIAKAESRFKNVPNYKYDGEVGRYSAFGIFQFTRTTWMGFCTPDKADRMDIEKNIDCAVRMISEGKTSHWSQSAGEWETTKNHPVEWFLSQDEGQKI